MEGRVRYRIRCVYLQPDSCGGLASAFGYTQVLEGISVSITALSTAGVDVRFLAEVAVLAGLGLSVWK